MHFSFQHRKFDINSKEKITHTSVFSLSIVTGSFPDDDGDETFIPFEQTKVSKFGPISRLNKAKIEYNAPVQVTADVSSHSVQEHFGQFLSWHDFRHVCHSFRFFQIKNHADFFLQI